MPALRRPRQEPHVGEVDVPLSLVKSADASLPVSFSPEVGVLVAPGGAAPAGAAHNVDHPSSSDQSGGRGGAEEGQRAEERA